MRSLLGWLTTIAVCGLIALILLFPRLIRAHGRTLRARSRRKRKLMLKVADATEFSKPLVIGFFHPYCNAGGGGERVLWAAIRTTLQTQPNAFCLVYTGDTDVSKNDIIERALNAFGIDLDGTRLAIVTLSLRRLIAPETWPHFTLIGQSLGSIPLVYEAMEAMVPDIFIDTMGYAFTYPVVHFLLNIPIASYTHYPTISTDMLSRVDSSRTWKLLYWKAFALLYSWCGRYADLVMTNSTWTMQHIESLWKLEKDKISIVYPPCDTKALSKLSIDHAREKVIVCVAQFRKEKDHETILQSFSHLVHHVQPSLAGETRLLLIGTVRNIADRERVVMLKQMAKELRIDQSVEFRLDEPWPKVVQALGSSWIGVNAMWNEHFGIGVVEYMAAGLIPVVHDSAGPKLDIVTPYNDLPTGFHATDVSSFAAAFDAAFSVSENACLAMRRRARQSCDRFSESTFERSWSTATTSLVRLEKRNRI